MRRLFASILIIASLCLALPAGALALEVQFPADEGVAIREKNSDDVVYLQNENERFYPASTTKLMTALVTMDVVGDQLDTKVTVGDEIDPIGYESSVAHLEKGEVYTYEQLLYALLLPSGNDTANVLAAAVGRVIADDPKLATDRAMVRFVQTMNERAADMGLSGTHFVNAHGLHDPEHYTTPLDLLAITEAASENPTIAKVEGTKIYTMTTSKGEEQKWKNTNVMLYKNDAEYGGVISEESPGANPLYRESILGGKTGNTDEGGRCFTFVAEDGEIDLIGVILKSSEKGIFEQAGEVVDDVFLNYSLVPWTDEDSVAVTMGVANHHYKDPENLKVTTAEPYSSLVEIGEEQGYTSTITWDNAVVEERERDGKLKLMKDVEAEEPIGTLTIYNGDIEIKSTPVLAGEAVQKWKVSDYLRMFVIYVLPLLVLLVIIIRLINKRRYRKKRERAAAQREAALRARRQAQAARPQPNRSRPVGTGARPGTAARRPQAQPAQGRGAGQRAQTPAKRRQPRRPD